MATPTPRHLFRCWSDQCNGTNSSTLFSPAARAAADSTAEHEQDFISLEVPITGIDFANQLRQALLWKKDQDKCPFAFFTSSAIFAIQLAVWRNSRKQFKDGTVIEPDTGVHMTIIDAQAAKTTDGSPVHFQSVKDLLQTYGVELKNRSDDSIRQYADHLQDLIKNGFYELYPQIEAANDRNDPGQSSTTDDLRKYFFQSEDCMSGSLTVRESLDTVARLAMCFRPATHDPHEEVETGDVGIIMALSSSLRRRNVQDSAFQV